MEPLRPVLQGRVDVEGQRAAVGSQSKEPGQLLRRSVRKLELQRTVDGTGQLVKGSVDEPFLHLRSPEDIVDHHAEQLLAVRMHLGHQRLYLFQHGVKELLLCPGPQITQASLQHVVLLCWQVREPMELSKEVSIARLHLSYELVQILPSHLLVLEANVSGQLLWSGRPVSLQQSLHIRSPWVAVAG